MREMGSIVFMRMEEIIEFFWWEWQRILGQSDNAKYKKINAVCHRVGERGYNQHATWSLDHRQG